MDEQIRRAHPFAVACESCGALIVWFRTKTGKRMPVDESSTQPTDAAHQLDLKMPSRPEGRHVSHFSTCPQANDWRRSRG